MKKLYEGIFILFFITLNPAYADDTAFGGSGASPMPIV